MIKGVNHQIIEIRQTDHPYFERALLFVKAPYSQQPPAELQAQGTQFLRQTTSYSSLRQNRAMRWFKRCVLVLFGGIGGVIFGVLMANVG